MTLDTYDHRMYTLLFVYLATLCSGGLGALPVPPGPYIISNPSTGRVFTDRSYLTNPGNPIIGYGLHSAPVNTTNQQWMITQVGTIGASGVFTLVGVDPAVHVNVAGFTGAGLNVQSGSTPFTVTELTTAPGEYSITFPYLDLSVEVGGSAAQLTLQPTITNLPAQTWTFVHA